MGTDCVTKDPVSTAYRELADLLNTLRRIVGRWMERTSGEGSFDCVCPPVLAEQLLERRTAEAALCRMPAQAESLLEHTTFTDLSQLLLDNLELIDRLVPRVAPSPEQLISRLSELEVIRLQLARAKSVSPSEIEAVREFHGQLLAALKRSAVNGGPRRSKAAATKPRPADPPATPLPVEAEDVVPTDLFGVDEALAVDDDAKIMRALHREVTLLADQAVTGRIERPALVWSILDRSGWAARNLERMRLAPVQRFQIVIDELRAHAADGANGSELRRLREESGFTRLLLEMRESFLSSRSA